MPLHTVEPRRLYRQIADQIAGLIAAEEFVPGARLPELLNARTLVEGEIAALAAENAREEDLAALRAAAARMAEYAHDFAIREETDRSFHLGIARATGNSSLELVVEGLWNQRSELWSRLQQHFHTEALAKQTIRDHASILAAISAHDAHAARAAMHRHLARVLREFQRGVTPTRAGERVTRTPAGRKRNAPVAART